MHAVWQKTHLDVWLKKKNMNFAHPIEYFKTKYCLKLVQKQGGKFKTKLHVLPPEAESVAFSLEAKITAGEFGARPPRPDPTSAPSTRPSPLRPCVSEDSRIPAQSPLSS